MRKLIYSIFMLSMLFYACTNHKEQTIQTEDNSKIKFANDVFEFGKIKQGEKVSHEFEFKNTGDEPLIISNASASCGCTIPEWPKEPIEPGKSGKIKVLFNSAGKSGLQDKMITITANTNPVETKLHLIGEVLTDEIK